MDPCIPRKRGGQPGNTNALKHGLYAAARRRLDDRDHQPGSPEFLLELAILLDLIRRLHHLAYDDTAAGLVAALTTPDGVQLASQALTRLRRARYQRARLLRDRGPHLFPTPHP